MYQKKFFYLFLCFVFFSSCKLKNDSFVSEESTEEINKNEIEINISEIEQEKKQEQEQEQEKNTYVQICQIGDKKEQGESVCYCLKNICKEINENCPKKFGTTKWFCKDKINRVKIVAVGDIMMHDTQIKAGLQKDKKYNFDIFFTDIKDIVSSADIAIGNLETTLAGPEKKFTGYPMFNAPKEIAFALKKIGFDVLGTANNHSLDRRFYGIKSTLDNLDKIDIDHMGTARNTEEDKKILIKTENNIKFAFLGYTYGTNGISIPSDKKFSINLINNEEILNDIKNAKIKNPDFIIANVHFGSEYQKKPNKYQKEIVDFLCKNGVDIIFGSHPHVLQKMEIKKINENKECFIAYSLGNFVSAQEGIYKNTSIIAEVLVNKNVKTKEKTIESINYIPIFIDKKDENNKLHFKILAIEKALKSEAKYISKNDKKIMKKALENTLKTMKSDNKKLLLKNY